MEQKSAKSEKIRRIVYWVATLWLSLGMVVTAGTQLIPLPEEAEMFSRLGYPLYLLSLIGVWKLLGVVAVLIPGFLLLKEWAYAGFFFAMSGAVISHLAVRDAPEHLFGPMLLLVLTLVSWYFRPADRRLVRL